jgi:hypothetical protein
VTEQLLAKSTRADFLAREEVAEELCLECFLFVSCEWLHVLIVVFLIENCFFLGGIR